MAAITCKLLLVLCVCPCSFLNKLKPRPARYFRNQMVSSRLVGLSSTSRATTKGKKAIRYNVPVGFGEEARPWEISSPFTLPKVIMGFEKLRRRRFMIRRKPIQLGSLDSHGATMSHEGLKTVRVDNRCDFSSYSDLCICVVTWNMNGQVTYEDLAELVGNNRKFDLLVVGLQEVPRKNISRLLQAALLDSHILLGKSIMQSIHLYVFGLKDSDLFTKEVKIDKSPVGGFGGLIRRKKGAVAIRLNYKGITMVFISCHLSAHAQNVEKRNSEFRNVSESLFSQKLNPYARPAQITVWLGDLNYRIQGIGNYPARDLIHNDLHRLLTNNDQLLQEAERGQIFKGYSEGTLTFKPTYKYNIGSSNYDTSYKVRMPSWTDRILFKTQDTEEIHATLHSYEAMDDIHSSDHKPVKAHICLKLSKPS